MRRHEEQPEDEGSSPGATEPIMLNDPDGAVTLVAPWSSWTREQVRAPGGEPALITRLEQGQLWFSAGRRRSPWRHEVHIAKVVVSTPAGRFHVTAEPDGGATIDCLAGRTRVQAGLAEPVVLEVEQTAAVASDGATLVVLDNASSRAVAAAAGAAGTETSEAGTGAALAAATVRADADVAAPDAAGPEPVDEAMAAPVAAGGAHRFVSRLPELVAVAALLAVLVAAVVVFSRGADPIDEVVAPARAASTTVRPSTTVPTTTAPTTTAAPTTTTAVPTTAAPATAPPPAVPASATGRLAACRRADGGVLATIDVSMRSGGPGQFTVGVGLVDGSGQVFARGEARTEVLEQGASAPVDVLVAVPGAVSGACQLLGVEAS